MILLQCNDYTILPVIKVLKNIFLIIEILAPALAIVSLSILMFRLMVNPQDPSDPRKDNTKLKNSVKNAVISLVIIFLIPVFVNVVMGILGEKFTVSSCWNNADKIKLSSTTTYYDRGKKKTKIINEKTFDEGYTGDGSDIASSYVASGPVAERIASAAEYYAWPEGTPKSKYCRFNGGGSTPQFMSDYRKYWPNFKNSSDKSVAAGTCCCHFARTCVVKGLGKKFSFTLLPSNSSHDGSLKTNMEKLGFVRMAFDGKKSSLKRGDVLYYRNKGSGGYVWIYLGNGKAAEDAHNSGYGGRITTVSNNKLNTGTKSVYYVFRSVK